MAKQTRQQVVGYVSSHIKTELTQIKETNSRLTESALVEEALVIALPQLKKRYGVFAQPVQVAHGRKNKTA